MTRYSGLATDLVQVEPSCPNAEREHFGDLDSGHVGSVTLRANGNSMEDILELLRRAVDPEGPIVEVAEALALLSEQARRWQDELMQAQDNVRLLSDRSRSHDACKLDDWAVLTESQAVSLVADLLAGGGRRIAHARPGTEQALDFREVYEAVHPTRRTEFRELISLPADVCPAVSGILRHKVRTTWTDLREMVIIDDVVALIPSSETGRSLTFSVVRQRAAVGQMAHFFDTSWTQSEELVTPLPMDSKAEAELKRQIILLLAEGAKDETVARKLDLSLRTCRRKVADILCQLESSSRFQAGVRAAMLGMIPAKQSPESH